MIWGAFGIFRVTSFSKANPITESDVFYKGFLKKIVDENVLKCDSN